MIILKLVLSMNIFVILPQWHVGVLELRIHYLIIYFYGQITQYELYFEIVEFNRILFIIWEIKKNVYNILKSFKNHLKKKKDYSKYINND